jgi:hypothetical protein
MLFLFSVGGVLTAKRTELFQLDAFRMQLFVLVRRVVALPTSGAFEFDELSHVPLFPLRPNKLFID